MAEAMDTEKPGGHGVDLTGDGGVIKEVLVAGQGAERPEKGDEIQMHYTGQLEDGSVFDSSLKRGQPFKFKLGKGSVIAGWDIVAQTMAKGEKAMVTLAPQYAYGETGTPPRIPPNATLKFEMELVNWISVRDLFGDGGLIKTTVSEGEGWERPADLSEVTVKAIGTQLEPAPESVFYEGEKTFSIGSGTVPAGWEKVVQDMKLGARVKLCCTGKYTSDPGMENVPPEATKVEFDLTLLSWLKVEDLTGDRGVIKKILKEGDGWETPNEGALVTVSVAYRKLDNGVPGEVFEQHNPFIFKVIDGAVVDGLDKAVQKMKNKEKAIVYLKAPYAFGSCPNMCPKEVSPDDDLQIDIEIISFERAKDSWSMSFEEKIEEIKLRKNKGNDLFKAGRSKLAKRHYEIATGFFECSTSELKADARRQVNQLTTACQLNIAACYSKENNNEKVLYHANKALEIEPSNVKALYRRGCAYMKADNHYKALQDFKHALEVDPENIDTKRKLRELNVLMAKQDAKEKGLYSSMFAKANKNEA
mmetsp:Transcript_4459/g.13527  ORF Transcript_4459/g.13527 Transcript_4459/m.13527 type:complete len:531 (+) Transcript_4459:128-1720(+)|eukprot:CAMPEP_0198722798 /NCGR_PEP_ID=MMETSP1475-20131203/423_1 /TAXON_ID= ORGANISM="Unidentified sp., Strain CCMP1999" /NCGR_SAMPLE_ID=MMETSP1475 /ASSEMBLY_ACC=CAM_ASM_001111 /LENGTH=530 /DNA_ID=CAMNT_0044483721 /DNA_START=128 /DNA_END=1720 /DNA_ORIENTATION=-